MKQTANSFAIYTLSDGQHCLVLGWDKTHYENLCKRNGKKLEPIKPLNYLEIVQTSILKQSSSSKISLDESVRISTKDVATPVRNIN